MMDLIFALALLLLGRDGAVIPLRPAPLVTPMINAETLEQRTPAPPVVLYAQEWGS
jgi:hypothetical protein